MPFTIAIDTGGTFTDLAAVSDAGHTIRLKVPSTPDDPSLAVLDALKELEAQSPGAFTDELLHGTTVATNAVLEGTGADAILITNAGFEDILALRRQDRPKLYALHPTTPSPLIPRERIIGIRIRRGPSGELEEVMEDIDAWMTRHESILARADSAAICLLHAYKNGEDENVIAAALRDRFPNLEVTLSHILSPTFREYERSSTCAANAVLSPLVTRYLEKLAAALRQNKTGDGQADVLIMGSAGGLMNAKKAGREPVHTVLSGPAGGVRGAWLVGQRCRRSTLLTLDMGGTSTDVSLIAGGLQPESQAEIAGYALSIPVLPIETVGAGGGSIARIDSGGILRVGPQSAGADPGPACYGRGGQLPTVTDAHVVLGRLDTLLGGHFALDKIAAHTAVATLAIELDVSVDETAQAILEIAEAHMVRACKRVTRERGLDPRTSTLVAFGGAGGLHACRIAEELGCKDVLFPREPGVLSAEGIACAPREVHGTKTLFFSEGSWSTESLSRSLRALENDLASELGTAYERRVLLDCRYAGQTFTLPVSVDEYPSPTSLRRAFDTLHTERYGYMLAAEKPMEIVALRMYLRASRNEIKTNPADQSTSPHIGPCVVSVYSATLYVPDGWRARQVSTGDWICERTNKDSAQQTGLNMNLEVDIHRQRLSAIAEEMGATLMGSAFSTNIKERRDFSCGVFDAHGQLLAHAAHIPVHLGSTPLSVRAAIKAVSMRPGEHVILNDPFQGGTHLPDVTLVSPVFLDARDPKPSFYVANRAHHADVGGITPGSLVAQLPKSEAARPITIDDEGFRTGPVRLTADVREAFATASRTPLERDGDLRAQEAANQVGIMRIRDWTRDLGLSSLERLNNGLLDYTERLMANTISGMPDGQFIAHDQLDDDGTSDEAIPLSLTLLIEGSTLLFDFTSAPDATPGALNAVRAIVESAVFYCMRCTAGEGVPANEGLMRPMTVLTRPGSVLDAVAPSAVSAGNVETSQRVVDLIFRCLAQVCPQHIPAASAGTMNNVLFGGLDTRHNPPRPFVHYETLAGGAGAGPAGPGASGVHVHMTNTLNTPIEALEQAFPVRIDEYSLNDGPPPLQNGHSGGRGITRVYRFLEDATLTLISERRKFRPYGLHGAPAGPKGRDLHIDVFGNTTPLAGKVTRTISAGESIRVTTPGGGSWQSPAEKS